MSADFDVVLMAILLLFFPFAAHAGAIGGDIWRPDPKGLLNNRLGRLIIRRMNSILFLNGCFSACAYILWRFAEGPFYWIVLVLSLPTVAAQFALAGASGAQSNR